MSIAKWTCVSRAAATARSSHCLVSYGKKISIYGGEFKPRTPVDADPHSRGCIHTFDLAIDKGHWKLSYVIKENKSQDADVFIPAPRVGAAMVTSEEYAYMWGGRGGVEMNPVTMEQAGLWRTKLSDTSVTWEYLKAQNEQDAPEPRSYHSMVFANHDDGHIFIHAGCPTSGRLNTLHSIDLKTLTWNKRSDAPPPARGGTALIHVAIGGKPSLIRFGGFSGYELGGDNALDIYDITTDVWHTVKPSPDADQGQPGARSVCGFVPYNNDANPNAIAILFYGERDASTLGHAGAGTFWDDVWMLCYDSTNKIFAWKKLTVSSEARPEARGWFAFASLGIGSHVDGVVMHGGLLGTNERADELWLLQID